MASVGRDGSAALPLALDERQRAAAAAEAPALVVAGPGTGKTTTLVGRVAHLVFERGVEPGRILALTFSNKAAREMSERVASLLARAVAPEAQPTVSTLHAFCGELLRRYGPLVELRADYRLITEAEGYMLLRQVASGLPLRHYQPLSAPAMHFPAVLGAISRGKDELADPDRYLTLAQEMQARASTSEERGAASQALEVARLYAAYQGAVETAGNADFGDLIRLAVRLLREHADVLGEVRGRYTEILVDEFQDINRAMGALLETLAGPHGRLWAVGDADQAIYRFRGASPANLARFTATYPAARIYPLATNYRSRPPIVRAAASVADTLLGQNERVALRAAYQPDATQLTSAEHAARQSPEEPAIIIASAPDEAAELAGLVAAIRTRVDQGYSLADQAVLCRSRRQCQRVAAALTAAGLKARLSTPLLDAPDVKSVLGVIALLVDASGTGLLRAGAIADHAFTRADARALLVEARSQQATPVSLLLRGGSRLDATEGLSEGGRIALKRLGAMLADLWAAPDVATGVARYVFALTDLGRRAIGDASPEGRQRAVHLARLLALGHTFEEQRRGVVAGSRPVAAWGEFLDYLRVLVALGRDVGGDDDAHAASDGLRVLTVHASKGLEFPIVYLPELADGRFPVQRRGEMAPPPPGLSDDAALEARDGTAHVTEEACLVYVAITRARETLIVSHAERYGRRAARPSPFLKPLLALAETPGAGAVCQRWPAVTGAIVNREPAVLEAADEIAPSGAPASSWDAADTEPALPVDEALPQSALETYQRCPRQYAYRYVYQLRPREVGLGTLRRSLHATIRDLQAGFASAAGGADVLRASDAHALFERHWRAAVAAESEEEHDATQRRLEVAEAEGPFGALYRRHGHNVVERAWRDLVRERGLPLPADGLTAPDDSSGSPYADAVAPIEDAESPSTALPLAARLGARVQVRVGGHPIEVTVDRVEGTVSWAEGEYVASHAPSAADATAPITADMVAASPRATAPVRFVRHRVGHSSSAGTPADLRALLYALAAEQSSAAERPKLVQHNLTSGTLEPMNMDPKRQARLRAALHETLAAMERGSYPPRPDPFNCQACPFALICPA